MTKLYLGFDNGFVKLTDGEILNSRYLLISYYYWRTTDMSVFDKYKYKDDVIVDSGAFTFLSQKNSKLTKESMRKYAEKYADFIIKNKFKYYVELDLDALFEYEFVLELREYLENRIGYPSIPIWHSSRGRDEFIKMCKDYDFAGIGGIAGGEELSRHKDKYSELNKLAKAHGCKIHGMGFTPTVNLNQYGFYTVDSTSWTAGGRFGAIFKFDRNRLRVLKKPKGKGRLKSKTHLKFITKHNLREWIKYQEYCDRSGQDV